MLEWISTGAEDTQLLGRKFASYLQPGDIVTLKGDLGAGKTTFAKGLIAELTGCKSEEITSPTFTYMQLFSSESRNVYHFDLYRLNSAKDFIDLGFDDYLHQNEICCIEWAERIESLLPSTRVNVTISHIDQNKRLITITKI